MRSFRINGLGENSCKAIEFRRVIRIHVSPLDLAALYRARSGMYYPDSGIDFGRFRLSKSDPSATASGEGKRHQSLCLTKHVLPDLNLTR